MSWPIALPQFLARVGGALEQQAAVLEHDVVRAGAEHREVALVDQVDVAESIERDDLGMRRERLRSRPRDTVCSEPTVGRMPGPMKRSACSVWPTQ